MISAKIPYKSTVIVRVDYNIPSFNQAFRILTSKRLICELIDEGFKVVLLTHYKRPKNYEPDCSAKLLQDTIEKQLEYTLEYINQYSLGFDKTREQIANSKKQLFLLENVRYSSIEDDGKPEQKLELASKYAMFGDYFIDEAFAVSHRQDCTNYYLKKFLPWAYGYQFKKETEKLEEFKTKIVNNKLLIMGGAKLETKLPVIRHLIDKVDKLILGGLLCFTFIEAQNILNKTNKTNKNTKVTVPPLFYSLIEPEFIEEAKELLTKYPTKITLPSDLIYTNLNSKIVAVDLGLVTTYHYKKLINTSDMVFWNGPMGFFEHPPFDNCTNQIAKTLSEAKAKVFIGGGDTEACLNPKLKSKFYFISTGGGASLEYLKDNPLIVKEVKSRS
jgi:phosphoglycerate kinase